MRKRRILSVIAACAVAFCLAGCQKDTNTGQAEQSEQTSIENQQTVDTEINFENWSPDDFTSVQCHGIDITIPCKLSDIDEKFDVKIVQNDMKYGSDMVELYYNDEYAGALAYDSIDTDTLVFFRLESFDLYGLNEKSTKEDVQNKLGFSKDSELFDVYYGNKFTIGFEYLEETALMAIYENPERAEQTSRRTAEIEPPEDGWTLEQLNDVLYMNGQKIEVPLMFSTLKEGYEIRDKEYYDDVGRSSGYLYYDNQFIAIAAFYESEDDYKIVNLIFPPAHYKDYQDYSNYIVINGFGLDTGASDVPEYLGNGFTKESGFYVYVIGDDEYTILVSDYKSGYMIVLFEGVSYKEDLT